MKNRKFNILNFIILVAFLFDFLLLDFHSKNYLVIGSFFAIGLISVVAIMKCKKTLCLYNMVNIFFFFFFYYCGLRQYCNSVYIWDFIKHLSITDNDYLIANALIIIFQILFIGIYKLKPMKGKMNIVENEKVLSHSLMLVFLIVNTLVTLFVFSYFGVEGVFSYTKIKYNSTALIVNCFIRMIPFSTLLYCTLVNHNKNDSLYIMYLIFNSLIVFILFFPFGGASRYCIAAVYLSLLGKYINKIIKNPSTILLFFLFGIFLVFPSINFFRYNSLKDLHNFKLMVSYYDDGDFDAYMMFVSSLKYVKTNGLLFGSNFLTGFLFFIPRSIMPIKNVGTGALISGAFGAQFTNVSCPFIAEEYIAFGIIGIIFITIIFSLICKYFDSEKVQHNILKEGINYICIGFVIFLLRGDFLSSYAYLMGCIFSYLFVFLIGNLKLK